jgi:hypothetical protein
MNLRCASLTWLNGVCIKVNLRKCGRSLFWLVLLSLISSFHSECLWHFWRDDGCLIAKTFFSCICFFNWWWVRCLWRRLYSLLGHYDHSLAQFKTIVQIRRFCLSRELRVIRLFSSRHHAIELGLLFMVHLAKISPASSKCLTTDILFQTFS